MTSSNGNIFRVTGPLCGEFTGTGEFPAQRPVTRSFDVFFDLHLNKRLSKQPRGWWFGTPAWSVWRHRNDVRLALKWGATPGPTLIQHWQPSIVMMATLSSAVVTQSIYAFTANDMVQDAINIPGLHRNDSFRQDSHWKKKCWIGEIPGILMPWF